MGSAVGDGDRVRGGHAIFYVLIGRARSGGTQGEGHAVFRVLLLAPLC